MMNSKLKYTGDTEYLKQVATQSMKKPANIWSFFSDPIFLFLGIGCFIGILILSNSFITYKSYIIPEEDQVLTNAVVTKIQRSSGGRIYHYTVFVRYTVDEQDFESRTNGDYSSGIRVEDNILIYYDRNHPFKIQIQDTSKFRNEFLGGTLLVAGSVFIGIGNVIKYIRSAQRRKE